MPTCKSAPARNPGATPTDFFSGYIERVGVWNTALDDADILRVQGGQNVADAPVAEWPLNQPYQDGVFVVFGGSDAAQWQTLANRKLDVARLADFSITNEASGRLQANIVGDISGDPKDDLVITRNNHAYVFAGRDTTAWSNLAATVESENFDGMTSNITLVSHAAAPSQNLWHETLLRSLNGENLWFGVNSGITYANGQTVAGIAEMDFDLYRPDSGAAHAQLSPPNRGRNHLRPRANSVDQTGQHGPGDPGFHGRWKPAANPGLEQPQL